MKIAHLTLAAVAVLTSAAFGGDSMTSPVVAPTGGHHAPFESISLYNGHEFQLDLFGTFAFADGDGAALLGDDTAGGGIGFQYFINPYIGLGGEGMLFDTDADTLGSTAINVFLRAPLGDSGIALYGFAGAGVMFNADNLDEGDFDDARDRVEDEIDATNDDDVLFEGHVGLGVEFRFSSHMGIFTDVRHTFVELDESDYTSARAGLRITF